MISSMPRAGRWGAGDAQLRARAAGHTGVMNMSEILFDTDGDICTISLNRPERRNAVDGRTAAALRRAFERFEQDAGLRVAVLTGAGGHCFSGADLCVMHDPAARNEPDPAGGGSGPVGADAHGPVQTLDRRCDWPCRRGQPGTGAAGGPARGRRGRHLRRVLPSLGRAPDRRRQCMLADRRSAFEPWSLPLAEALRLEGVHGVPMAQTEGEAGAGRHGRFGAA